MQLPPGYKLDLPETKESPAEKKLEEKVVRAAASNAVEGDSLGGMKPAVRAAASKLTDTIATELGMWDWVR